MKSSFIISLSKKKIGGFLLLVGLMILSLFLFLNINQQKIQHTSNNMDNDEYQNLLRENRMLRGVINMLPTEDTIMYENPYRFYRDYEVSVEVSPLADVIKNGKDIPFSVSYKIPEYQRPIYDPSWAMWNFRGWLRFVPKVKNAMHRLFVFPLGASSSFDFTGELGFHGSPKVDAHRNINFLIYNFEVEEVKLFGDQIALIGKPKRSGVEVIAVNKDELLCDTEIKKDFLIQLLTPSGYEIDYVYERSVMKYDDLMREIRKHSVTSESLTIENPMTIEELKSVNEVLRKKAAQYVPIQSKEIITAKECRQLKNLYDVWDIETACEQGTQLEYEIHYQNADYRRPIYNPSWKANLQKGWAYLPSKLCNYMHTLFYLTNNTNKQSDLLGKLSFNEGKIPDYRIGFLIYNFNVESVAKYNQQLLITGTPSRNGAVLISIDKNIFLKNKMYLAQLVTPDCIEVDYDIIIIE